MPSLAKANWDATAMAALSEIDGQCDACSSSAKPNPVLLDENLRAYVMLLSAHFQAYCRKLYSECASALAKIAPQSVWFVIQKQCLSKCDLEKGNPRMEVLKNDFERFGIDLSKELAFDKANALRITHLDLMNKWRNYAAHREIRPPYTGALILTEIRTWKISCDELTGVLDSILYNYLQSILGEKPW